MSKWLLLALVLALLAIAGSTVVLFDHARAGVRIVPLPEGLEASEPERLATPAEDAGSGRRAVPARPAGSNDLVVRVLGTDGKPIVNAEVLAQRGRELLRAGEADRKGQVRLIPFRGGATLRVRAYGSEIAREELAEGRGEHELVVRDGACVAGVVRGNGAPRAEVELELVSGSEESWAERLVQRQLEDWGLRERTVPRTVESLADGSFRFAWLPESWSGSLRLVDDAHLRFADGSQRVALAGPREGLELGVVERRAAPAIRARVVLHGEPVPGAAFRAWIDTGPPEEGISFRTMQELQSDAQGTVSFPGEGASALRLELFRPGLGRARVDRASLLAPCDLGDIELEPTLDLPFVVTDPQGEPVAGARALPKLDRPESEPFADFFLDNLYGSEPTDADGRGVLRALCPESRTICVWKHGFQAACVRPPADSSRPLPVVLERAASLEVRARDALGDVPPGLEALLFADVEPFNLWMCCEEGAEPGLGARDPSGPRTTFHLGREADPARIEALRPGVPLRLLVSDEWGTELGSARELMLAPGELRVEEFEVTQRPRTLLLTVRDSLGLPVRWVTVRAAAAGAPERPRRWLLTDRAGMARVEALYAAEVSLELSRAGFEPRSLGSVRVPPEGAALEVVLAHDWWPW